MKKNTQRLFIIEIVLSVLILVITFSIVNLIFIRSMTQHQENRALMRITEDMILISEEIKSLEFNEIINETTEYFYDANGDMQNKISKYTLKIELDNESNYILYHLGLYNLNNEKLLSWDVVKVVE